MPKMQEPSPSHPAYGPSVDPVTLGRPLLVLGPAYSGKSQWAKTTLDANRSALVLRTAPEITPSLALTDPHSLGANPILPPLWKTVSSGLDLTAALLEALEHEEPVLVDSLNQWIGRLIAEEGPRGKNSIASRIEEFIQKVSSLPCRKQACLTLVTSEAGASPPPAVDQERFFRLCLGVTNQRLASVSRCVVSVHAGLPVILKAPF